MARQVMVLPLPFEPLTITIEHFSFGHVPKEVLITAFHDGRTLSPLLEAELAFLFGWIREPSNAPQDFHTEDGLQIEQKLFTRHGSYLLPSSQLGVGRKFDPDRYRKYCLPKIFILCDINNFPTIRVLALQGNQAYRNYPRGRIPASQRPILFKYSSEEVMAQKIGKKRDETSLEQFYTKPSVAQACLERLEALYSLEAFELIVEPSAGDGAFYLPLKKQGLPIKGYDLEPHAKGIKQQDFFLLDLSRFQNKLVLVVGNPPFGRQSSQARAFVKRCCQFAHTVAFILPASFKKPSVYRCFEEHFTLLDSWDLPPDSFVRNGQPYDVPCVFQVWESGVKVREDPTPEVPLHFAYTKKEAGELAIRRVGVYAGRVDEVTETNPNCYYYITSPLFQDKKKRKKFIQQFSAVVWGEKNTVGPRSLSKGEVTAQINAILPEL